MLDLREREFNPLKILHHIDRLRALAGGKDTAPVTVEIDPVAFCNHDCSWCVDPVHHPAQMSTETFRSLIDELATFEAGGFRVEGIVFKGGGEPTLHPQFGTLVDYTAGKGLAVGVVTNGSRLDRWAGVLAERAAYVRVSIDGPTPESHYRIHRSNDFETILKGVESLVRSQGQDRHPIIGFSFAMDIHTVDLAGEAIRLGERCNVNYVLLRPPFFEEVGRQPTMTVKEAQRVRMTLRQAALKYDGKMDVFVGNWVGDAEQQSIRAGSNSRSLGSSGRRDLQLSSELPIEHRTGRCLASPVLAVITADGDLYGCCNLRALPEWSFGRLDYPRGVGFSALWHGEKRLDTLARMHRTDCIKHCTHPLSRYNEIIEVLRDYEKPHSQFV
ncbi:MAG: radical SAM protein [Acidobacteriota bacterium]|nr:MAG: radical SAM protein [Acidobacteriota bacterium]